MNKLQLLKQYVAHAVGDEQYLPGNFPFYHQDTEKEFLKNKQLLGDKWLYSSRSITYTINSQGYRTREFDSCIWSESIAIMGCSVMFGTGIDDLDTCASIIEQQTKQPVINLSIPGGSTMLLWANTVKLLEQHIYPKIIIYVWPPAHRTTQLDPDNYSTNLGPWSIKDTSDKHILGPWHKVNHGEEYWKLVKQSIDLMCSKHSYILHYTWRPELAAIDPTVRLLFTIDESLIDLARDRKHPGVNLHRLMAQLITKDLQEQNLI